MRIKNGFNGKAGSKMQESATKVLGRRLHEWRVEK